MNERYYNTFGCLFLGIALPACLSLMIFGLFLGSRTNLGEYVFFLVGVVLTLFGVLSFLNEVHFRIVSIRALGEITGYTTEHDSEVGTVYYPDVTFRDRLGQLHHVTIRRAAWTSKRFREKASVDVLYKPGHPHSARIDAFSHLGMAWLGIAGVLVMGYVFLTAGLLRLQ